jgi:hypothetical protein
MPRVFVVNNSGHDFSAAKQYGDLVFMSSGSIPRYNVNQMYREFSNALIHSEPEDFILCTALTQMNMVAAAIFAHLHGRINLLIHKDRGYVVREVDLTNLLDENGLTSFTP